MKESATAEEEGEEKLLEKAKELCEKEGKESWKLAQKTMLKERPSNRELEECLEYITLKYQPEYFRPALLSFSCKAVGRSSKATIPTGAALILFAWAIGIHDDIIDGSKTKGGRPTVFGKFGKDLALILSDVLLFRGFTLFRETLLHGIPAEKIAEVMETIEEIWFEQSVGEAIEIKSRGLVDITPERCLGKIRMRASEMEACTRIGGILGNGSTDQVNALGAYGRLIGMMGILRNELIDMLEPNALRHRIRRETLPLPLVYGLQDPGARPKLTSLISSRLSKDDLLRTSKLSDGSGGIEYVAKLIREMSHEALSCIKPLKSKELNLFATAFLIGKEEWRPLLSD